jgi:hypothetical protein
MDALVHYWYWPDSYDRCIPATVAPENVEADKRIKGNIPCPLLHDDGDPQFMALHFNLDA